ncbi:leucine/isoleucine/valine transporter permease subunit [Pelotomaculum schinkii]|uniref:Leucine/isoleucine/valine transporter permease subunit n=1 Tax=Pelotomaculum schinkii TaxID=78350 RepID=A0A4Y7RG28_9FIRM|nr:branched-chain amino acid ABC transporter permease [Pelotomaculum schinkii]TEB07652.1 leucine/isoleucine/valine transporter permease subunit [Pelotomaculum schinkii]
MSPARKKIYTVIALAALFIILGVLNNVLSSYHMRLVNLIGINIALVVSLNLTNGFCGVFSLGHAGFMAVGAYVSAILSLPLAKKAVVLPNLPAWLGSIEMNFLASLIIGGLAAALCAFIIGYPVLRLRGHYLAVATLGFLVIVQVVFTQLQDFTRGARGINGLTQYTNVWWVWVFACLTVFIVWRIINSAYGRGMLAIREDDLAAEAMGVNLTLHKLLAFCVGAFFAGTGGSLWGHLITVINPLSFSYDRTFFIVVMSIVGGMNSITGGVAGAAVMTVIPEMLRNLEIGVTIGSFTIPPLYGISQIIMAVVIIIIFITRPKGIVGTREFSWDLLHRKASKQTLED